MGFPNEKGVGMHGQSRGLIVTYNIFRSCVYKKRLNKHIQQYHRKKINTIEDVCNVNINHSQYDINSLKKRFIYER
jgi:hypothetical protein